MKKIFLVIIFLLLFIKVSFALTYTVTNTTDSGVGSLRQAISDANGNLGADIIAFDIPDTDSGYQTQGANSWWRIQLLNPISISDDNTQLLGSTQTTNRGDTNASGPEIEIDGQDGGIDGIEITSDYCTVEGLVVNRFNASSALSITGTGAYNEIKSCYIGTDITGGADSANTVGIYIDSTVGNNTIGGTTSSDRNIISGNTNPGIVLDSPNNTIIGNYIGLNVDGDSAIANGSDGIVISVPAATGNIIGGEGASYRNVISGNSQYGIQIDGADNNQILGNYIGTDLNGSVAIANDSYGIFITNASSNTIGASNSDGRNVISGNDGDGVNFSDADDNYILGNYIGISATGSKVLGNGDAGIFIDSDSSGNYIGDGTSDGRNIISGNGAVGGGVGIAISGNSNVVNDNYIGVGPMGTEESFGNAWVGVRIHDSASNNTIESCVISGNSERGIYLGQYAGETTNARSNEVLGNYIGTDYTGIERVPNNLAGIIIAPGAQFNMIGNGTTAGRNVIAANDDYGIEIRGPSTSDNQILGNYIGTTADGSTDLGNAADGIYISTAAQSNYIGNSTAQGRNIISSNGGYGIYISGLGTGTNEILGNYIGVDVDGINDLGNTDSGIFIDSKSAANKVGGQNSGDRNIIAGNGGNGVYIDGAFLNEVLGNYIGVDNTGGTVLQNDAAGIVINNGSDLNIIGNGTTGGRNIISGNGAEGISINDLGTEDNSIKGNYIGTDSTGLSALPNMGIGILLDSDASSTTIGGTGTNDFNIISGNKNQGIRISSSNNNTVLGNYIGVDATGSGSLPNQSAGIYISEGSNLNTIGGLSSTLEGNVIAYNGNHGVDITGETTFKNLLSYNSFFNNSDKAINLNDSAQSSITYPIISTAEVDLGTNLTTIRGTVETTVTTVEIYQAETGAGSSSQGEGEIFLILETPVAGGVFTAEVSSILSENDFVTAIAIDNNNNTSEFAFNVEVTALNSTRQKVVETGAKQKIYSSGTKRKEYD